MGIPMGVPYFKIKDSLKHVEHEVFSSNFTLYRDISRRVFLVMEEHLERVERYSIDEAFFTIQAGDTEQLEVFLCTLKQDIMKRVGVPVSIGVSHTKTQAKYANGLAKKTTGVRVVENSTFHKLSSSIALSDIWGVGRGRSRQFTAAGLETVADLLKADRSRVERLFGIEGLRLWSELGGVPAITVSSAGTMPKSIMSSRSFKTTSTEVAVLSDAIAYHVRHVAVKLREKGLYARFLQVTLRPSYYGDYLLRGGSKEVEFTVPSNHTQTLLKEAIKLTLELYESNVPYQKVGVTVSGLEPASVRQGVLFEPREPNTDSLMQVLDTLNSSRELVKLGSYLREGSWQSRRDKLSPAYTTQWEKIAVVRT